MGEARQWSERDVVEAVTELIAAVKNFSADSRKWSRRLFWLTVTIAFLTFVMVVAIAVQILIALLP